MGTTNPTHQLSIVGDGTTAGQGINISNVTPTATTASSGLKIDVNGTGSSTSMAHAIEVNASGATPMLGGIYSTLTTGNATLPGNGNQGFGGAFAAQAGATSAGSNVVGFDANIYTTNSTASAYGLRVTDRSWATGGNLYGVYIDLDDTDVSNKYSLYVNSVNSPAYFGSNVGIGTSNPGSFKLNVSGSVIATDYFAGDGSAGATSNISGLVFKDGLYTAGTLPDYIVTEIGDISSVGSMTSGDVFNSSSASGQWLGLGPNSGRIHFIDSATDYVNILDARLGIGITSPQYSLDVAGTAQVQNLRITSLPSSTSLTALVIGGSQVGTLDLTPYVTPTGTEGQMMYNNNGMWTPFSNMFWDDTNLRLGINTTNPTQTLDVNGSGLIGNVLLSNSSIGILSDTDLISLGNSSVTINGTLTTTGAITAPSSVNTINGIVIDSGSITSGSWLGSTVQVPYGGTGATSLTDHGVLVGSGEGAITALTPGTDGQVLLGVSGDDPIFRALSGDISSISSTGVVSLANTGVVSGTYGSSNLIPQISVDSKGRLINVTEIDLTNSLLPTGVEGQMLYNNGGIWTPFSGMFWNDTNNYLGLGTTSPTQKLDVVGSIRVSGAYYDSNNSSGNVGYLLRSTNSGAEWTDMSNSLLPEGTTGQMLYYNGTSWIPFSGVHWSDTNNRLGIGNTNPMYELDVVGTISTDTLRTGSLYLSGTEVVANAHEINMLSGRSGTLLDSLNAGSYVVTTITAGSGLSSSSTGPGSVNINVNAGYGLFVDEDSIGMRLSTGDSTTATSSNSGLEITSEGLRMLGGCSSEQVLAWNSTTFMWECADPSTLGNTLSGSGVVGQLAVFNGTNTQYGSNNLFWNSATNSLGIGTTDPTSALTINPSSLGAIQINPYGNLSGNTGEFRMAELSSNGTNYTGFKSPDALDENIIYTLPGSTGASDYILTWQDGNTLQWRDVRSLVGAGDITSVGSMTEGDVFNSSSANGQWLGLGPSAGRILFSDDDIDNVSIMDARLGIGTSNPLYTADIYGTLQTENLRMTNAAIGTGNTALILEGSDVRVRDLTNYLLPIGSEGQTLYNNGGIWTPTDSIYWDDINNRLGIRTTTPGYNLDVNGSLNTTYFYIGGQQVTADAAELNLLDGRSSKFNSAASAVTCWPPI